MHTYDVKLKNNSYKINIGSNFFSKISSKINRLSLGNHAIIITSPKISSIYSPQINKAFKGIEFTLINVADGEKAKSKKLTAEKTKQTRRGKCRNKGGKPLTTGDTGGHGEKIKP